MGLVVAATRGVELHHDEVIILKDDGEALLYQNASWAPRTPPPREGSNLEKSTLKSLWLLSKRLGFR